MRILYLVPFVPWIVRVRSYHLIPRLGKRHDIFLLCRASSSAEETYAKEMEPYCKQIRCVRHPGAKVKGALRSLVALATPVPLRMAYFASNAMRSAVRQAVAEFSPDLIYVERWRALQWVPEDIDVPIVADPTDSMTLYNWRLVKFGSAWEKLIGFEEAVKFAWHEPRLSRRGKVTIFCSGVDLECVKKRCTNEKFAVVGNGVDTAKFFLKAPEEEQQNRILFTGSFTYGPNRRAVQFFLREIFPIIRQQIPGAKFVVVGNQGSRYFGHLTEAGVEVLDFVPELRPQLAQASVDVAPMAVAVGMLTKLLEAFATGTPVVATSRACTGLSVEDGKQLLVADTASAFAAAVVQLLLNAKLRRSLALNARKFVEQNCDWDLNAARMEQLMQDAATPVICADQKNAALVNT